MPDKITKFINSLSPKLRAKLKEKLTLLKRDSFKMPSVKKLKGSCENEYRLRIGKIRIIYKIENKNVEVVDIDYRGNVY